MAKIQINSETPKFRDFGVEVRDYTNRDFTAWFQVCSDIFVNVDTSSNTAFFSDCNNENKLPLSKYQSEHWLDLAKDLFEERYWQEIEQAEEEYREWSYTENQDNLRKSLKIA